MNLRRVYLLFRKELTDLLRDRRTLVSVILAPMLIGPIMTAGFSWYFTKSRQAAKVERYRVGLEEQTKIPGIAEALQQAGLEVKQVSNPREAAIAKKVDFGVAVSGKTTAPAIEVFSDNSEMKIQLGTRRVTDVLEKLRDIRIKADLQRLQVPATVLKPFTIAPINIAQPRKMTGAGLGTMLAFLLLISLFNGAMYSAVDMTAGEKERRTLEILLSSAASRQEIVCGKVLTAITTALVTASLSILSYIFAFSALGRGLEGLTFPTDAATLLLMFLSIVPIAILGASLAVALATPARSTREAMSYLTPVLFVVMFLGLSTFAPELQQNPLVTLVPIANFARMLRQLLLGEWSWAQYLLTVAANLLYASIAVMLAVRKFQDESVLFRS